MPNEKSEIEKLFQPAQEPFIQEQQTVEDTEELPEDAKNRHVRRLEAKLQREREANIELAAKYAAMTEAQKFRQDIGTTDDLEQTAMRIYGTEKPENAAATELLLKSLKGFSERAKREALEEFRAEQQAREAEVNKEVETIESYIEQIEDQYGVDLSSSASAREKRTQYLELLEKLSPKNNGEIVDYADPFETYELFAARQTPNRAKELSRMTRSKPVDSTLQEDSTAKFLKEQGLLEPF